MPDVGKLKTLWFGGALVLFGSVLVLAVWGALIGGAIGIVAELAGYDSEPVFRVAAYTVPVWGPLAIGYVIGALPRALVKDLWFAAS